MPRPALGERLAIALLVVAALSVFGLAGCSRAPAPVMQLGDDAVPGLIEVELEAPATVPGRVIDQEAQEDDLYGDAFSPEYSVEIEVDPAIEGEVLAQLRARKDVIWAEPVVRYQATWLPDDPDFSKQWHLKAAGAPQAWDATRGEGVTVAVIDTGIYPVDDLDPARLLKGWNFVAHNDDARDDHAHGTHVAGTIAQSTGNGVGVAGMAPLARLMPIKVLSAVGSGTSHDIAEGIRYAVDHGARVLNLSLGGGGRSLAMETAVAYARRRGAVVVCAAGNGGSRGISYPAAYPGAFAVSAVGPQGRLAPYSSYGPEVAIAAPGGDKSQGEEAGVLQETLAEDSTSQAAYRWFQGTSMATPHVAGAAALVMSLGVTAPAAVEGLLTSTAKDAPEGSREKYGAGLLDANAAVRKATVWWGLWRLAFALVGAWFALRHARGIGQLRASEKTGPLFWASLGVGAGALALLAPMGAERIPMLSFLALPPAAWPHRFLTPMAGYLGWSALVPFLVALPARMASKPLQTAFGALAAGLAFGWAGTLLHAALFRTVALPWMPAMVMPFWLLASALVAWLAGRGLLARESLR
ncbi:MAG TPA: S8 family peptidase [Myxococcales bacterium]|nr:S8 family peptidase [Myxococcales bacterium]